MFANEKLCKSLEDNPADFVSLDLTADGFFGYYSSDMGVTSDEKQRFMRALAKNTTVLSLNLSLNSLYKDDFQLLSQAL
ncbi:MAG: hypothetical protein CMF50_02005 [Legionellales bacterium]|nr:hypothetical protein [Legionellales bacterium]|tara:strand:- start:77891 stop:78127 length:237 start_codon:yes stop_codon:yes gene_type:complete